MKPMFCAFLAFGTAACQHTGRIKLARARCTAAQSGFASMCVTFDYREYYNITSQAEHPTALSVTVQHGIAFCGPPCTTHPVCILFASSRVLRLIPHDTRVHTLCPFPGQIKYLLSLLPLPTPIPSTQKCFLAVFCLVEM